MAKTDREGFHTVETDLDELDEKIYLHRKKIVKRVFIGIVILALAVVGLELWMAVRSYHSYEVLGGVERTDSEATHFVEHLGKIIKYSNDGIMYMDGKGELFWAQSFEMTTPMVAKCKEYLVVYDQGGLDIYIMKENGLQKQIETTVPIQKVSIAGQGTIAVLMKEGTTSFIKLYDKNGNELANGEFYANQGGFPVDVALSYDAQKLAVDMIDVNDGNITSTITFYNFGSVGQNEINNNVGMFSYSDMLIPQIAYISDTRMLAFGDDEIVVFEGTQKPKVATEIFVSKEMESIFYNDKYIGIVTKNGEEGISRKVTIYDMKGSVMMEVDTELSYDRIQFLENSEICLLNENSCEIYTVHGIKKFTYSFDQKIYEILSQKMTGCYIFIFEGETEEVRLQ